MAKITVRPDRLLPLRTARGIQYTAMSNTFSVELKGLTSEELERLADFLNGVPSFNPATDIDTGPGAPELPPEFKRRLELE